MNALSNFALAFLFSTGLTVAATAATTSPAPDAAMATDQNSVTTPNSPAATRLSQKLRQNLSKAGFQDIKIMPSSFLVRAKDSDGNPVMMVINPDSVTELTETQKPGKPTGAANGPASSDASQPATTPTKQ